MTRTDGVIEAESIGFQYSKRANKSVLTEWSATFNPGTITSITGPSGRGKSTLLYLLGLMLQPTSGHILIDGTPASRLPDAKRAHLRAHRFGFVFQDAALDSTRTVLDNITEAAVYRGENLARARRRAADLMGRFNVDVPLTRKPAQVSGGQAQRIALCRALVGEPQFLLADEPTGNLDPATAQTVIHALAQEARRGATVIVVTHSADVSAACDREVRL